MTTQHFRINKLTKCRITMCLSILMAICGLILNLLIIYQQYFCADALYMRDNCKYLSEHMPNAAELDQPLSPLFIKACRLKTYSDTQLLTYMISPPPHQASDTSNPAKMFGKLFGQANDDYIQELYTYIQTSVILCDMIENGSIMRSNTDIYQRALQGLVEASSVQNDILTYYCTQTIMLWGLAIGLLLVGSISAVKQLKAIYIVIQSQRSSH